MASTLLAQVWSGDCTARGRHRLVLAALADSASATGAVQLSERALGEMVAMPKTSLRQTIAGLVEMGFVSVIDAGAGGRAATYRVAPLKGEQKPEDDGERCEKTVDWVEESKPPQDYKPMPGPVMVVTPREKPVLTPAPPPAANLVPRVVEIAGLKNPTAMPLYWHQQGHKKEAEKLAARFGGDAALIERLTRARDAGKIPAGLTRISALAQVLGGAR